jgi:hypothetical protein
VVAVGLVVLQVEYFAQHEATWCESTVFTAADRPAPASSVEGTRPADAAQGDTGLTVADRCGDGDTDLLV